MRSFFIFKIWLLGRDTRILDGSKLFVTFKNVQKVHLYLLNV